MPTKITFILIACGFVFTVKSQNPPPVQNSFGEILYPHAGSILTAGTVLKNNPGFLMTGFNPVCNQGVNFYVDRTAPGGDVFNNPQGFQRSYSIFTSNTCSIPLSLATNCYGVSAIETNVPASQANGLQIPPKTTAIAGAVDNGCFISFLAPTGVPVNTYFINFALIQGVPAISSVSKPIIREASTSTSGINEYYICGTYNFTLPFINNPVSVFYAHKINEAGVILWSRQYLCSTGGFININDMIESPYTPNLVIVGSTLFSGLVIELDRASGGTNLAKATLYNVKNYPSAFSSITVSNPQSGTGAGYILGGVNTPPILNSGRAWITKLNPAGNVVWSTALTPSSDKKAGNVTGVIERKNQSGAYEYYGVTSSTAGALVMKLNQQGLPVINGGFNEFVFNSGSPGNPSTARSISFSDGAGFDDGLHVFGNNLSNSPTSHYFVETYFSGHAGCNTPVNIKSHETPEIILAPSGLYDLGLPLVHCGGFNLNSAVVSSYNAICGPVNTIPLPANNARAAVSVISNVAPTSPEIKFNVFPNPVTHKALITYENIPDALTRVELYNSLGQLIKVIRHDNNQQTTLELDFASLNLESGVYYVSAGDGVFANKQKVIYTRLQ